MKFAAGRFLRFCREEEQANNLFMKIIFFCFLLTANICIAQKIEQFYDWQWLRQTLDAAVHQL